MKRIIAIIMSICPLLAHAHEYQIIGGHHLNNSCEYNDACTASSKTATDRDYLALAKAYGIIRYFSPNHHTEQWNDDDWFKIGYYYAEKLGREATEDIINEMILVFAPEAYLSSKPKEKTIKVKDADLSSYQYRLHTGGGYISAQGYTPFHKDIVICSEDMPDYAPEVGKWYSYEVSDRMFLNMQSAARTVIFSKEATDEVLNNANDLWEEMYDESADYMNTVISIFNNKIYRVTDLMIRWNIIQHFYPYKVEDSLDWDAQLDVMISEALSSEYDKAERNTVFKYWDTLKELYSPIKDAHLSIDPSLRFPGLPARYLAEYYLPLSFVCFDDCVIIGKNGLEIESGSRLTKISGEDIDRIIEDKSRLLSYGNKNAERYFGVTKAISTYDRDSLMNITYITPDGVEKVVESKATLYRMMSDKKEKAVFEYRENVLIVNLCESAAFEDNFYNSFMTKVNEENPKAIIFDVRGYPTYHFQNILAHLNDTEMSNGFFRTPLFALPNQEKYGYNSDNATIKPAKPKIDTPCYFICDYRALSWAETVLMYVKEYDLGIIVGTPTCGTTGDITQFQFPAFCVTMTGLHAAYLDGEQHHGVGVKPDIIVKTSVDDYLNGKDTHLETVIKLINK